MDFLSSSDFQLPAKILVEDNKIKITLNENLNYNHDYSIVLEGISSLNGLSLKEKTTYSFYTQYRPIYATIGEVRAVLYTISPIFKDMEIYRAIRDAGIKVHQMKREVSDPNHSSFKPLKETDRTYYTHTRFVVYEAARQLLAGLISRLISQEPVDGDGDSGSETGGGLAGFKLGDFEVTGGNSGNSFGGVVNKEDQLLTSIRLLMKEIERELKFWRDAMMSRNARGYAKISSASYRADYGSPESRELG